MNLIEQFKQATNRLEELVYQEQEAKENLLRAEWHLANMQSQKILEGNTLGKNDAERQAKLAELTRQEISDVQTATELHNLAKARLRGAELQHQYLRYALKLEIGFTKE